jgi:hypothetical protein
MHHRCPTAGGSFFTRNSSKKPDSNQISRIIELSARSLKTLHFTLFNTLLQLDHTQFTIDHEFI